MAAHHELMGGKLHVYKRENSSVWQCSTYLGGRNHRRSTGEESLPQARDIAEDWYLGLMGKFKAGQVKVGKPFRDAATRFEAEYDAINAGERSPVYIEMNKMRIRVHLKPFFGDKVLSEITPGLVQDYRAHRLTSRTDPKTGEPKRPSRSTLHQEIVVLRQILKFAHRHAWIDAVPDLSPPYKSSPKITHRAWFSPAEYKALYEHTRERAKNPLNPRWRKECENFHDYVIFMSNTGLRPDEAGRLEYRDVEIAYDETTKQNILHIEVRGKRGVGYCKSMPGAVPAFERLKKRNNPQPTDRLFPKSQRELFNAVLDELNLKIDRDGQRRSAYSLRHTYICFRLMEGADIYAIAKNCRTSVEMIEKFYASHLKNTLDTSQINVMKAKPRQKKTSKKASKKTTKPRRK